MGVHQVIIDAGHGGVDSGGSANGMIEKDWTLKISKYQYKRFKSLGIPVKMTRKRDKTLYPHKRAKIVRNSGCDVCICNHLNIGGGYGYEIIHSIYDMHSPFIEKMKENFKAMHYAMHRIFTRKYPHHSTWDYYYMNRETGAVKTYIIEYGYMDNDKNATYLKNNWKELAESVVKSYCETYNFDYDNPYHHSTEKLYCVQVGAFKDYENAKQMCERLKNDGFDFYMFGANDYFKVQAGAFYNKNNAEQLIKQLKEKGYQTYLDIE